MDETCPRCGATRPAGSLACAACGEVVRPTASIERRCPACGGRATGPETHCRKCGASLVLIVRNMATTPPPVLDRAATPPRGGRTEPRAGRRIIALRADGASARAFDVGEAPLVCGRSSGQLRFPEDTAISPEHARFELHGALLHLVDLGGVNGSFVRLRAPRSLTAGDELRIGRQLLRLEAMPRPRPAEARPWGKRDPGYRARVVQLLDGGGSGEIFPLVEGENGVGREAGRVSFPGDRFVSARHARLDVTRAGVTISDLGSSNGTFVRVNTPEPLLPGDQVLVGQQLLRVE